MPAARRSLRPLQRPGAGPAAGAAGERLPHPRRGRRDRGGPAMKLSTRAEYGIRVLVTLARAEGSGPVSLTTVARNEKLPHAYLEQLVADLRRAQLVTATRGKSGGYSLARPAADINLVDAMRALDGPILEMPCAGPDNLEACSRPQDCSV